ncbi:SAV1978 family virulence-associated passenger protein [Staphylococcus pseudintermedius]|uniref:SAV1978 family virulence-associated passenger protein n=1 Tax=Staphylococcus pseudintermedius TaxID=283734 RepID=UPI001F483A46|nr:SAV1978 family virulence-associated passenger protein [Staphylococcus pseudintermedius]MDU9294283.1 SAV1978 family virulence-associated passenger protein [Staphylococcus pseudintermedius]
MKQFFGSKRYLYRNGRKVAHIHIVNGIYHFHGHFKTKFSRLKLEFNANKTSMTILRNMNYVLRSDSDGVKQFR